MEATITTVLTDTLHAETEQQVQQEAALRELTALELNLVGGGSIAVSFL